MLNWGLRKDKLVCEIYLDVIDDNKTNNSRSVLKHKIIPMAFTIASILLVFETRLNNQHHAVILEPLELFYSIIIITLDVCK